MNFSIQKAITLVVFTLLPSAVFGEKLKTTISAEAAILINAESGHVLFEKNADSRLFPASITKVATALYILDNFGHQMHQAAQVSVGAVAAAPIHLKRSQPARFAHYLEPGAVNIGLQAGESISVAALLEGFLIHSANDAGNALAEHISGNIPKFVEELNQYLHKKGYINTEFRNPHGLHHPEHRTTARDMAGIARAAMQIPLFQTIVRQEKWMKPQTNKQPPAPFLQGNRLLRPGRYYYPYATGIKTGYTANAKCTLVASAKKGDRSLIAVVLGCENNDARYRDTIALFEAAFMEKKVSRLLLTKEHETFSLPMRGVTQPLKARMTEDLIFDYYPTEEPQVHTAVTWDVHHLPIRAAQQVGSIDLLDQNNSLIKSLPLVAVEQVDPTLFWQIRHYVGVIAAMRLTKVILIAMLLVTAIAGWIFLRVCKAQ